MSESMSESLRSTSVDELVDEWEGHRLATLWAAYADEDGMVDAGDAAEVCALMDGETAVDLVEELGVLYGEGSNHSEVNTSIGFEDLCRVYVAHRLRTVFEGIDEDGSGSIDATELQNALIQLGMQPSGASVRNMLGAVDKTRDGRISFSEFCACFASMPTHSWEGIADAWTAIAGVDIGSDFSPVLPPAGLPLWRFLIAGSLGSAASRTATAPLERVKLLLQVGVHKSALESAKSIVHTEGVRGLFFGNLANVARAVPFGGISCLAYSRLTKILPCDDKLDPMEPVWRMMAGAGAGATATLMTYPLDVIRARLATQVPGEPRAHETIGHATRHVVDLEGIKGLYRGVWPTLLAMAVFVGVQQSSYDLYMSLAKQNDVHPTVGLSLALGAVAGVAAQTVVYPLDVVRRRMQTAQGLMSKDASETVTGHRTWLALRSMVNATGKRSLFAGIMPTYFKVAPAVAVTIAVRDAALGRLEW